VLEDDHLLFFAEFCSLNCRFGLSSNSFFKSSIPPGGELLTQRSFENFAGRILGQCLQKDNLSRRLELRYIAADVPLNLIFGERLPRLDDDRRHDLLAKSLVGDAEDGGFGHRRMQVDAFFDLARRDVFRALDDQVFSAVGYADITVGAHVADVARAQPSISNRFARGLGLVEVARMTRLPRDHNSPISPGGSARSAKSTTRISTPGSGGPTEPTR
jgi:hypothetical protein